MQAGTALIVGAGIGGLAAATSLRRRGWSVLVYERAQGPGDLGFALALAANAMNALEELGVAADIRSAGFAPRRGELCAENGRVLKRIEAQMAGPLVIALRRDLHNILLRQSEVEVQHAEVTGAREDGERVTITLSNGTSASGDVVIGADGVGSILRKQLHPDEAPPRPSGYSSVRGVTMQADALGALDGAGYFGHGFEAAAVRASRDAIYWYLSLLTEDVTNERVAQTIVPRYAARLDARFRAITESTTPDRMRFDELFARPPLATWGRGRITLLGDAAHPVLPHTGQGAAQAIEDAVALGLALAPGAAVEPALRRYETVRAARTKKLIAMGPRIARLTTTKSVMIKTVRTAALRMVPASFIGAAPGRNIDPHALLR